MSAEAVINQEDPIIPSIFALDGVLSYSRRPQKRHVDTLWTTTAIAGSRQGRSHFIIAVADNHCCHLIVVGSDYRRHLDLVVAAENGTIESCCLLYYHEKSNSASTKENPQWSLLLLTSNGQLYCGNQDQFSVEFGSESGNISHKKIDASKCMTLFPLPPSQLKGMTTMTPCRGVLGLILLGSSENSLFLLLEISLSSCEVLTSHEMEHNNFPSKVHCLTMVAWTDLDTTFAQSLDKDLGGFSDDKDSYTNKLKVALFYGLADGTIWYCGMHGSSQAGSSPGCNSNAWQMVETQLMGGSCQQDQSISDMEAVKDEITGLVYGIVFLGSKGDVALLGSSGNLVTLMPLQETQGRWSSLLQIRIQTSTLVKKEEGSQLLICATNETTGSSQLYWWGPSGDNAAVERNPLPIRSDLLWCLPIHGAGSGMAHQQYFIGFTKGGAFIGFEVPREYSWGDWVFSSFRTMGLVPEGEPSNGEWAGTLRQAALRKKALQRVPEEQHRDKQRKRIRQSLQHCSSLEKRAQQIPDDESLQTESQLKETNKAIQAILQSSRSIYDGNGPTLHGGIQTAVQDQQRVVEIQVEGVKQYTKRKNCLQDGVHICLPLEKRSACDPRTVDGQAVSAYYGGMAFSTTLSRTSAPDPSGVQKQTYILPDHHEGEFVSSCLSTTPVYTKIGDPQRMNPTNEDKHDFWNAKRVGSDQRMMIIASQNLEAKPKK